MNRRDFLSGSGGAALFATLPGELLAQAANPPDSSTWNAGALHHLLQRRQGRLPAPTGRALQLSYGERRKPRTEADLHLLRAL